MNKLAVTLARLRDRAEATRAEMIVPVVDCGSGDVVGTSDVASERVGAFAAHDRHLLEDCARVIAPLWTECS